MCFDRLQVLNDVSLSHQAIFVFRLLEHLLVKHDGKVSDPVNKVNNSLQRNSLVQLRVQQCPHVSVSLFIGLVLTVKQCQQLQVADIVLALLAEQELVHINVIDKRVRLRLIVTFIRVLHLNNLIDGGINSQAYLARLQSMIEQFGIVVTRVCVALELHQEFGVLH